MNIATINSNCNSIYLSLGEGRELPIDLALVILQSRKQDLPSIALVCKNWKALVDEEDFRQRIHPTQAFGAPEWKEYIGVEVGKEPRLPRCVYGDLEKGRYMLTFIPEKIQMINENGNCELVEFDNLEAIGRLVENPRKGPKIIFIKDWFEAICEKRKLEKPHWVLISKDVIGKDKTYTEQQNLAKNLGITISGLIDTVVSMLMVVIKSGEEWDIFDDLGPSYERTSVRVNEMTYGKRLSLVCVPTLFSESYIYFSVCYYYGDFARSFIAAAPSWKAF